MKKIMMNFAISAGLMMGLAAPTYALEDGAITKVETQQVKGLVAIEKRGNFHHTYWYDLNDGDQIIMPVKIKGAKDIRTEAERNREHPIERKIRSFCARWSGPSQFAANMFTCAAYLVVLLK